MATGSLGLNVTDPDDEPINGRIRIEVEPVRNPAGGTNLSSGISNAAEGRVLCILSAFFQLILEQPTNTADDTRIRLLANPGRVKNITAPAFTSLRSGERALGPPTAASAIYRR